MLRALRDISNEQFVSDKILTAQFYTDSGSIGYGPAVSPSTPTADRRRSPGGECDHPAEHRYGLGGQHRQVGQ